MCLFNIQLMKTGNDHKGSQTIRKRPQITSKQPQTTKWTLTEFQLFNFRKLETRWTLTDKNKHRRLTSLCNLIYTCLTQLMTFIYVFLIRVSLEWGGLVKHWPPGPEWRRNGSKTEHWSTTESDRAVRRRTEHFSFAFSNQFILSLYHFLRFVLSIYYFIIFNFLKTFSSLIWFM